MRTLVLGGTAWLGAAVAQEALAQGHDVTCLARGSSGPVPSGSTLVVADRADPQAYAALAGPWDLVVDVSRHPGHVRSALAALSDRAKHWAFVSSASVYADHQSMRRDESTPLLPAFVGADPTPADYGEAKVACEEACAEARGEQVLVARSGLIAGAGDVSDRIGYWPGRFALAASDGGPVLVPERLDVPCQLLDVRDLAGWLVGAGSAGVTGTMNVTSEQTTLAHLLDVAAEVAGYTGERVPVDDATLLGAGVEEFMGERSLPLWLADPEWAGFLSLDATAARTAGLAPRPLADTLTDALAWERRLGLDRTGRRAGLDRADELGLLGLHPHRTDAANAPAGD